MRDNLACLNLLEGDYFGKTKEADWMDNQIYFSCQLVELLSPDSGRQTISALQRFVSLYDDFFFFYNSATSSGYRVLSSRMGSWVDVDF